MSVESQNEPHNGRKSVTVFEKSPVPPEPQELNAVKRSRTWYALTTILLAGMTLASFAGLAFVWQAKNAELSKLEKTHENEIKSLNARMGQLQGDNEAVQEKLANANQELDLLKERYDDSERYRRQFVSFETEIEAYLGVIPTRKASEFRATLQRLERPSDIEIDALQGAVEKIEALRNTIRDWASSNTIDLPTEPF